MKYMFYIEVTDVFGGEANYSWVTRHVVRGKSELGAVNRFSRLSGMQWRNWHSDGHMYLSKSGATCFFITDYDEEQHGDYRLNTDDRPMKRFNPFPEVSCKYGAPLGRRSTAHGFDADAKLCVSKPQGEYDSGGAYWGTSREEGPVYAVWERGKGREGVAYVRARSPEKAVESVKENF